MELNCICGHDKKIHYDGQLSGGRFVCLVDNCNCRNFKKEHV
jgi:hypothetical protein